MTPAAAASTALLTPAVLAGCAAAPGAENSDDGDPVVLATFTVLEDMTAEVGGDRIDVRSITPVGAEVHEYDPSPSDVQDAAEADLIVENGLGLEEWFDQFTQHSEAETVTAADGVETQPITRLPGHPDDAGDTDSMPTDPHAWMSPEQAEVYVDNIESALADLSPDNAEYFSENAEQYRDELRELGQQAEERVEAAGEEVVVASCEGAFGYLAHDLGLTQHYLWPLNIEDEGTPQQVEAQIDFVDEHDVPMVFCESTVNDGPQEQVAEATDAQLGDSLYVDSLSEPDGPVPSYLELLEHNLDLILQPYE